MKTDCIAKRIEFKPFGKRPVIGSFDGEEITSDAGLLLIKEVDEKFRITEQLAECFCDFRNPNYCHHSVLQLLRQRIYGICAGYEDLNDHDILRNDPLFSILIEKKDIDQKVASKSTLNRIELYPESPQKAKSGRYHKVIAKEKEIESLPLHLWLQTTKQPSGPIILDFDATDDRIHGNQEGRFFHGYYRHYCYLPLYVFCGDTLLHAKLRTADIDASSGSLEILENIVTQIRLKYPDIQIIIRGDGGFCREKIMTWCESNEVDYIFGLPKNNRLKNEIKEELAEVHKLFNQKGEAVRFFKEFQYKTLKTWRCLRKVIAKAEHLKKGSNPRFIVTSLKGNPKALYEQRYCARGDMENRIKEQQLHLFADRTSCTKMRPNQLRLWFSSFAYVLMNLLREHGLNRRPYCDTMRIHLLKIGACIRSSCRRIYISFSEGYAFKNLFLSTCQQLARGSP